MINPLERQTWLLILVFGGILLDWLAIAYHWKRLKPITKPLALILLILWTLSALGWKVDLLAGLLVAAQLSGLMGDIFLLFSSRWFLWGLISFLIGHITYLILNSLLIADLTKVGLLENMLLCSALCIVIWLIFLVSFYPVFGAKYKKRHERDLRWIAIQVYFWILSGLVVISLLVLLMRPLPSWRLILLPLGAGLFLISDTILATNRFIQTINLAQLKVRITYHLAQVLLAIGFVEFVR